MPLSPKDAVDAATSILNGARVFERSRLERIRNALLPHTPTVEIPAKAPQVMRNLAAKSQTNFLPLVVDTFAQVLKVDGYRSAKDPTNDAAPWQTWQANGLRARQVGVHRSVLSYGAAYVIVTPGDPRPVLHAASPLALTAVYADPVNDDYPMLALYVDGPMLRLYDEESVYFIGMEKVPPRSGLIPDWWYQQYPWSFKFIERRDHGLGVCPVVRFRDRMLLDGESVFGIVEALIATQQRIDETNFGMLTAQYFSAFKQRYVIGWIPQSEQDLLMASASQLWTFKDSPSDVNIGELQETDLTRYIESKSSAIRDLAAIAQVPTQSLGIDGIHNVSAEALAGLEAGKDRKADEISDSLGESWRRVLQLAAHAEGDEENATDDTAQIHWQDATARSLAQTVDALGKMVTMLQVPPRALWGSIPGYTQTDVQEWEQVADRVDPMTALANVLAAQGSPPPALLPPSGA